MTNDNEVNPFMTLFGKEREDSNDLPKLDEDTFKKIDLQPLHMKKRFYDLYNVRD